MATNKPQSAPEESAEKNRPFDTRVGRSVTLTWVNNGINEAGKEYTWRSLEAHTIYKENEADTEWKKGTSYGASDVIKARASMEQALTDHHGGVDRELLGKMRAAVSLPRESHQPIRVSCGMVEGLIWRNEKEDGMPWYSLTHSCRYRSEDEEGNMSIKNGRSYGRVEAHQFMIVMEESAKQFEKLVSTPEGTMETTKKNVANKVAKGDKK